MSARGVCECTSCEENVGWVWAGAGPEEGDSRSRLGLLTPGRRARSLRGGKKTREKKEPNRAARAAIPEIKKVAQRRAHRIAALGRAGQGKTLRQAVKGGRAAWWS